MLSQQNSKGQLSAFHEISASFIQFAAKIFKRARPEHQSCSFCLDCLGLFILQFIKFVV